VISTYRYSYKNSDSSFFDYCSRVFIRDRQESWILEYPILERCRLTELTQETPDDINEQPIIYFYLLLKQMRNINNCY